MRCLVNSAGSLSLAPEGSACGPADFVVITLADYETLGDSPFRLTVDEGFQLGAAILLVWAAAFGIRVLARLLLSRGEDVAGD